MFKKALAGAFICVAVAFATGPTLEDSYMVGATFGAGPYEAARIVRGEVQSEYKVAFRLSADLYRNDGPVSHLFAFDYAPISSYGGGISYDLMDFNYSVAIYFTPAPIRFAARPFVGGHFLVGEGGGSQGQLGVLGGARVVTGACSFSDIFFGWRGRYRALPSDFVREPEGWKSALVLENANTIAVYGPFCLYVTAAMEWELTSYGTPARPELSQTRKPSLAFGLGPAFWW